MSFVSAVRARVARKLTLVAAVAIARLPDTSRATFLAIAELRRRIADSAAASIEGSGLDGSGLDADRMLTPFELRVFSQNGEDGVIAEILRRAGAPSHHFVEIGAASTEANCALLADVFGWHGLFVDANRKQYARLKRKYDAAPGVTTSDAHVTPENIEALFAQAGVPAEPDVLSIDVDGEDYYLWSAIDAYRPRIVIIEYNSSLDPARRLVQPPGGDGWDGTAFYGASLGALESLASRKGYRLVHTDLTGSNAFFVRGDLPGAFPDPTEVPRRATNYYLRGFTHAADPGRRAFVDLDRAPPSEAG